MWHDQTVPTNQMMDRIHVLIDQLFEEKVQAVPVPEPEVSDPELWRNWFRENGLKKVLLELRDVPGVDTNIEAMLTKVFNDKWAIFTTDPATFLQLYLAGYKTVKDIATVNPPRIVVVKPDSADLRQSLYIPLSFFPADKVILKEKPLSPFTFTSGARKLSTTRRFCKCIKKVRKTIKNEKGPIAICVKSVLQKKGRTLKRFTCGKHGRVITQKAKH
jgi:hypothetical protein